jgi:hypothetical protein
MDLINYLLFEDPTALWVVLGVAWLVVLILWRRNHSPGLVRPLVVLPLAALGFLALDLLVETDHEAVLRSLDTMAKAADRGDATAFLERVSPDYRTGSSDKAAFGRAVEIGLGQYRAVADKPATRLETRADGKRVFVVTQDYEFRPAPEGKMPLSPQWRSVTWEGTFAKDKDGQWRLISATAVKPERITAEQAAAQLIGRLPMIR